MKNFTVDLVGVQIPTAGIMIAGYYEYQDHINPNGVNIRMDNMEINNVPKTIFPFAYCILGHLANFTQTNTRYSNNSIQNPIVYMTIVNNLHYENITIFNHTARDALVFYHILAHKLYVKNLSIDGLYFSPTTNTFNLIQIPVLYDITFSDFKISNSYLKSATLIKLSSSISGQVSMTNLEFVNVTLGGNTKLIVQSLLTVMAK
jgi:hypothetical protein